MFQERRCASAKLCWRWQAAGSGKRCGNLSRGGHRLSLPGLGFGRTEPFLGERQPEMPLLGCGNWGAAGNMLVREGDMLLGTLQV